MTNTLRVIDFTLSLLPEPIGDISEMAQRHLRELVTAYDALAPDWSQAPKDANWYIIEKGIGQWCDNEPIPYATGWGMRRVGRTWYHKGVNQPIRIPLGIDWRLCKWARPGVSA